MNCDQAAERFLDLIYDEADPGLRSEIHSHLGRCAACSAELETLRRTVEKLDAWEPLERPAHAPSVLSAAEEAHRIACRLQTRTRMLTPALTGVAAALVVVACAARFGMEIGKSAEGWTLRFGSSSIRGENSRAVARPGNDYLLILYEKPSAENRSTPNEVSRIVKEYSDWAAELAGRGQLVAGEKLKDDGGRIISCSQSGESKPEVATTQVEVIVGYFRIRAASYDEAARVSETCPHVKYGSRIELREIEHTGA